MISRPPQIQPRHLNRRAVVYVRQSSIEQVRENTGSTALQRDSVEILRDWGWPTPRIEVADDDLGKSGSIAGRRGGFDRLIEAMKAGSIGIVAVTDTSRLSRNLLDLAIFAEAAKAHDVLLAHGRNIVDFRDPNSEFIGMLLGLNAARENRVRIDLARRARWKKAEAGIATTSLPIGYVPGPKGTWLMHADARVREAIYVVFDKFQQLGSAGAVWRYCAERHIQLPGQTADKRLRWQAPSRVVITRILRNEAYAGAYIYGRTEVAAGSSQSRDRRRIKRPEHEQIRVPDHHPAYVTPAAWEAIQRRLTANRNAARPAAGRGEALLQGLLRCNLHDLTLRTVYNNRIRTVKGVTVRSATYRCAGSVLVPSRRCAQISAPLLDDVVVGEVLKVLSPPALETIRAAAKEALREHEALVRAREHSELAASSAVAEAERAYTQVDPNQQLVKQRFGARLEEALAAKDALLIRHRQHPLHPPLALDDATIGELQGLLADLTALWRSSAVTFQQRKALIRAVVNRVRVSPGADAWALEIEWHGGVSTRRQVLTHHGTRAVIVDAYRRGASFAAIAESLRESHVRVRAGARQNVPYSETTVRRVLISTGLREEFRAVAAAQIREHYIAGIPAKLIAKRLQADGVRHWNGDWTAPRVLHVVAEMRKGRLGGGLEARPPDLQGSILELHREGLFPRQIAARLAGKGYRSKSRHPVSHNVVLKTLSRAGVAPNSIQALLETRRLLYGWAGKKPAADIATELNSHGLRTLRDEPWTPAAVARKLVSIGAAAAATRRLEDFLQQWAGKLTLPEMVQRLRELEIGTARGREWTEENVRRVLTLRGLTFRRRRQRPGPRRSGRPTDRALPVFEWGPLTS
jgi:DNA invertase Pin-like site-specific DNA recombinase